MGGSDTAGGDPATRLLVFLTEDDRVGHRLAAEVLVERAREAGLAHAAMWRGLEGFGASAHPPPGRPPGSARARPVVVEVVDGDERVNDFLPVVRDLASGALVTLEPVPDARGTD